MKIKQFPDSTPPLLVLASTSPFRQEVLERLRIPFETFAPNADETPLTGETPRELAARLSEIKARTAQETYPNALIIGSDQVAVLGDCILGKPGTHEKAVEQLSMANGKQVHFLTGLSLLNSCSGRIQTDVVDFSVSFRQLSPQQIESYLRRDKPYNCAGSFKSEGLGIALLKEMIGTDPTTVIGLPLIRLVHMLETEGLEVL